MRYRADFDNGYTAIYLAIDLNDLFSQINNDKNAGEILQILNLESRKFLTPEELGGKV